MKIVIYILAGIYIAGVLFEFSFGESAKNALLWPYKRFSGAVTTPNLTY